MNSNVKNTKEKTTVSINATSSAIVREKKDEIPKQKEIITSSSSKPQAIKIEKKCAVAKKASTFKSWMPYTAITNQFSAAYKLQKKACTDKNGLRKIGDDYCVAMGTYYSSTVGDRFKITMSTGATFTVIISDIKSNRHTDSSHKYTASNGCMMEFLVDKQKLNPTVKQSGNVGSIKLFSGKFTKIEKLI